MKVTSFHSEMTNDICNCANQTFDIIKDAILEDNKLHHEVLVSEEILDILRLINYVIITGIASVFGVFFNIINIIVFIKMGFTDTVNISLLALAVADLCCILPLIWFSVVYNPLVPVQSGWMDNHAVQIIVGWPSVCFSRISGGLTAFITFERFLCVALPLKIKTIITPGRTVFIVVTMFIVNIAGIIPEFFSFELRPYINVHNITFAGVFYYRNGREIENFVMYFTVFSQLTFYLAVILSTAGLVRALRIKSKWRQTASQLSKGNTISTRDRKMVLMVVSISVIFIISYLPLCSSLVTSLIYKEYRIQGRYNNLLIGVATFLLCLQSINSSVNIFVYYKMSSRFRAVMLTMLQLETK